MKAKPFLQEEQGLAAEGGSKMPKEKCVELIRNLVKEETGKNPNKLIIKCETSRYVVFTHEKKVAIPKTLFDTWGESTSREQAINLLRKL